jgi:hypothetical protein
MTTGSIRSITISGREFPVDAKSDAKLSLGGWENSVELSASGASMITQQRSAWSLTDVDVVISDDRGDLGFLAGVFNSVVSSVGLGSLAIPEPPKGPDREFLAKFIESARFAPIIATLADETSWAGHGTIVGPVPTSTMKGTASLSFMGNGKMVKQ